MNEASACRQTIAHRLAPLYAENTNVAAVILGGSSARAHADRFSDIELGVFWNEAPTDSERQQVVERAGADLIRLYPYDADEEVWCDDFLMGRAASNEERSGILVEVGHYTTATLERTLDDVLVRFNPDELKQNLLAGVWDCIPLHGHAFIGAWRERLADYPHELRVAVVRRHTQIDHFWRWEMFLERGDNRLMLYQSFGQVAQKLLHILLALNGVYYFGFKWIDVITERLSVAPSDFGPRLMQIYHLPPAEGARELAMLVEETYGLLEQHLPEIDADWLRRVFRYQRPFWDTMPPVMPVGTSNN
jgi:hypothetical protein